MLCFLLDILLLLLCCCCSLQVVGDTTLELTVAQFWSALGGSSLDLELSFHGIMAQPAAGMHRDSNSVALP
jgi:hypothetical protein